MAGQPVRIAVDFVTVLAQLRSLGVERGGVLVVHAAFSRVGPVTGGPTGLITALSDALGPRGTLVMPSMADTDEMPFDPRVTPCRDMGIVADTYWRQPGVLRSDSPHAFAARGPQAAAITAPHPPDVPHGRDSPIGRAWALDAQVLLLGVGHDADTTIHLAENLAGVRYRIPYVAHVFRDGRAERIAYGEPDHCCAGFTQIDGWLGDAQRVGVVGHGVGRLARSRDIVEVAMTRLRDDETVFLHPRGRCHACDMAWRSLPV